MKPVEFILWMNGATGVMGDELPTPEQWAAIKEKLGEAVGGIVSTKLLERAEEVMRIEDIQKKRYAEQMRLELEMRTHVSGSTRHPDLEPDPRADHMKDAVGILKKPFFGGKK